MFSKRLKQLRKQQNLTQTELANLLNLSHGAIAMWETDKRQPDNDTLVRLANFFNVSVDYLLGLSNQEYELTDENKQLLAMIDQLSPEDREAITRFVELASKRQKKISPTA